MGAHQKEFSKAVELYESGLSVGDVAEVFTMSRQAMWKILKRRGVQFRPQLRFAENNHFHRGGAVRNANFVLAKALRKGLLVVGDCESCGLAPLIVDGKQRIQGHHDDYNFLLRVRWLCKTCHHEWHKNNTPVPRDSNWKPTPHAQIAAMGGRASRKNKK